MFLVLFIYVHPPSIQVSGQQPENCPPRTELVQMSNSCGFRIGFEEILQLENPVAGDHHGYSKQLGSPSFISRLKRPFVRGTTPGIGDLPSPWLLTTYKSWETILQVWVPDFDLKSRFDLRVDWNIHKIYIVGKRKEHRKKSQHQIMVHMKTIFHKIGDFFFQLLCEFLIVCQARCKLTYGHEK